MTNPNMIKELTVNELINSETERYIIPIYQRNYDWGKNEIETLILDLQDFIEDNNINVNNPTLNLDKKYYLGTLIVHKRNQLNETQEKNLKTEYEVIDGQQRLTTLTLLYLYLLTDTHSSENRPAVSIEFENRKSAQDAILSINKHAKDSTQFKHNSIYAGYKIINEVINTVGNKKTYSLKDSLKVILENNVIIYRVELPEGTDLNHYFEIMNSRGEQLEKHEIIKATLMSKLDEFDQKIFAKIWDACSNFENYLQASFKDIFTESDSVFMDNQQFLKDDFDLFCYKTTEVINQDATTNQQNNSADSKNSSNKLCDLLKNTNIDKNSLNSKENKTNKNPRYNKNVIEFPNFLQVVLSIFLCKSNKNIRADNINLDDKKIISFFQKLYDEPKDAKNTIKDFARTLFKVRYLFDSYIIKRVDNENDSDVESNWKIQSYKFEKPNNYLVSTFNSSHDNDNDNNQEKNKRLIWLQSMFHVSFSAQNYKYWLFSALYYLNEHYNYQHNKDGLIKIDHFIDHLELLGRVFMYGEDDYKNRVIDLIQHSIKPFNLDMNAIKSDSLRYPTITIYALNYMDYLLLNLDNTQFSLIFDSIDYTKYKSHVDKFVFTIRSSKEHFYPQNPSHPLNPEELLDSLGNLCLITPGLNSRLSNLLPGGKIQELDDAFEYKFLQSIKLYFLIKLFDAESDIKSSPRVIEKLNTFMEGLIERDIVCYQ